jgi:hypothetical protein
VIVVRLIHDASHKELVLFSFWGFDEGELLCRSYPLVALPQVSTANFHRHGRRSRHR